MKVLHVVEPLGSFHRAAILILRGLAQHTRIQELKVGGLRTTMDEGEALRFALTATNAPLKHLGFCNVEFEESCFSNIVKGIRDSQVSHITLEDCTFDEGSTRLLQDLFATPTVTNKRYSLKVINEFSLSKPTRVFFVDVL